MSEKKSREAKTCDGFLVLARIIVREIIKKSTKI